MTPAEYEAEIARLHRFVLELADRLYLVAGQLSLLAERKEVRGKASESGVVQFGER